MTKYCRRIVVSYGAVFPVLRPSKRETLDFFARSKAGVKKSRDASTLRHSRESGNPEAAVRNIGAVFFRKRRNGFPLSRE